ncbi:MAG: ABC transporter permease [Clostridia bacterium]
MFAILKKELRSMFSSPLAYTIIGGFTFLSAIMFVFNVLLSNTSNTMYFFSSLLIIVMIVVAILSMKFFSEERKNKTDQLLLTSPISLTSIVVGKFLSGLVVFICAIATSLLFLITVSFMGEIDWGVALGNYLGIILLGAALISIGMYISSLTQSQLVSAIVTISVFLILMLFNSIISIVNQFMVSFPEIIRTGVTNFLNVFLIYDKYQQFSFGILDISAIFYYLSIIAVFLFLTIRVLEKRRWN